MDTLLDNIMVYWLTGTAGTATWLYRGATEPKPRALPAGARVSQGPVTTVVEYDRASSSLYINARRRHCQWYKHSQWISTNDFFNRFDSR